MSEETGLHAKPIAEKGAGSRALAAVVGALGVASFDRALLDWLNSLVSFDSAVVLLYADRQRPKVLVDALDNPDRQNTVELYLSAAYLLDPFYLHARRACAPELVRLRDIVPEDFVHSDYVATYYQRSAVVDEINFLVPLSTTTYAISLERSIRAPAFSDSDFERLQEQTPLITALVRKQDRLIGERGGADLPDREHLRLERVLAGFGADVLTPREREVVGHMLQGRALAQIAAALGISQETARVHRRNIYDKLEIGSLAELFSCALMELVAKR